MKTGFSIFSRVPPSTSTVPIFFLMIFVPTLPLVTFPRRFEPREPIPRPMPRIPRPMPLPTALTPLHAKCAISGMISANTSTPLRIIVDTVPIASPITLTKLLAAVPKTETNCFPASPTILAVFTKAAPAT